MKGCKLYAMKPCLRVNRFLPPRIELGTARSADQRLTHRAIGDPVDICDCK